MIRNLNKHLFALAALFVVITGCKKDYESIEVLDDQQIQEYIKANNLNVQEYNDTGIYYQIVTPGTGAQLEYTDRIFATFTAQSLDGAFKANADSLNRFSSFLGYFASSNGYPDAFATAVKDILKKKGGVIRIIVPSHLAYGRTGSSRLNIPGNASLDCTITVHNVNNQTEFEDIFVRRYLGSAVSDFTRTPSGLYYQVLAEGGGSEDITPASNITVSYVGKLTNGTIFEQNGSYQNYLSNFILGWQEGLSYIKNGGKIRLVIPPTLGYGGNATNSIPANSILDFQVEVLSIED
jgi:FKBP-type peptidyl-prolyl cis-trans isomerase FkpA